MCLSKKIDHAPGGNKMKCLSCGIVKDMAILEVYPFPEDNCLTTDPLPPLLEVNTDIPDGKGGSGLSSVLQKT